jgi:hypothetical protein
MKLIIRGDIGIWGSWGKLPACPPKLAASATTRTVD